MTQAAQADPQIITLKVAREQGLKRYFTGKPCKRGHVVERYVSSEWCLECTKEYARKARAANPEKHRERRRKRRAANPEKHREQKRKEYAANPEKERERRRKRRAANPEKHRERWRKARAANPEKFREYNRKARAAPLGQLRRACEDTAVRLALGSLRHSRLKLLAYGPDEYVAHMEATLPNGMALDEARAAGYHVDHIVPMAVISEACPMDKAGRVVAFRMAMDLANLQMLPGAENISKHASFNTAEQRTLFDLLCARYLRNFVAS